MASWATKGRKNTKKFNLSLEQTTVAGFLILWMENMKNAGTEREMKRSGTVIATMYRCIVYDNSHV
jgi:hypothetical protein